MWTAQGGTGGPGDLVPWIAAGVALLAAMIATWQAYEARRSRKTAEDQAAAARAQADAAAEQVAIMRADRDDRAGPEFSVVQCMDSGYGSDAAGWSVIVRLRMDRGPLLAAVKVTVHGKYVADSAVYSSTRMDTAVDAFRKIGTGSFLGFAIACRGPFPGSGGTLQLECVEDGGEARTWQRGVGFTIGPQTSLSSLTW